MTNVEKLIALMEAVGHFDPSVRVSKTLRGYRVVCSIDSDSYPHAEGSTVEEAAAIRVEAFRLRADTTRNTYSRALDTFERIFPQHNTRVS